MTKSNEVGVFKDDGRAIAAAHWYRGRLGGYAVRGSAAALELGARANAAANVEAIVARKGGNLVAALEERNRWGKVRGAAESEGKYELGDDFQPERELRAAGVKL